MTTNTAKHAERELDILFATTPDAIIKPFKTELLALCEAFGKSGQSGGSAPYTAGALSEAVRKLCLQKTIAPLTGDSDEWMQVENGNDGAYYRNVREGAVFKDSKGAYYLDAIIWKTQSGSGWSGTAKIENLLTSKVDSLLNDEFKKLGNGEIRSRQYVKSFPFTPKTFVVDVIEKEVAKDDWEFTVKDVSQLDEVFEYYKKTI